MCLVPLYSYHYNEPVLLKLLPPASSAVHILIMSTCLVWSGTALYSSSDVLSLRRRCTMDSYSPRPRATSRWQTHTLSQSRFILGTHYTDTLTLKHWRGMSTQSTPMVKTMNLCGYFLTPLCYWKFRLLFNRLTTHQNFELLTLPWWINLLDLCCLTYILHTEHICPNTEQ